MTAAQRSVEPTDAAASTLRKQRAGRKTDAAVALMMAIGRAQASEADPQPDISAFFTDPLFA